MIFIANSLLFIFMLFLISKFEYFKKATRLVSFFSKVNILMKSAISYKMSFWMVYVLFYVLFFCNLSGNVPLNLIFTLFYSQTFTISLLFWIPIMACMFKSQLKPFFSHMLPYGCPVGLMLFLPLIEGFSQLIRPLTLMIRLSTNLSSGHIMLYIFSYFTMFSSTLSFFIIVVIVALYILEVCISMLQAYIFSSLIDLYIKELTVV